MLYLLMTDIPYLIIFPVYWAWWHIPRTSAIRWLRQSEGHLGYGVSSRSAWATQDNHIPLHSSVVEHLLIIYKVLILVPRTGKKKVSYFSLFYRLDYSLLGVSLLIISLAPLYLTRIHLSFIWPFVCFDLFLIGIVDSQGNMFKVNLSMTKSIRADNEFLQRRNV